VVIIYPFWGVLLLWPVLLCYPHALTQNLLPLNVGFDDLFITFVFITTVGQRAMAGGLRFGKWGLFVLTYWILFVLSNAFGMAYMHIEGAVVFVMKDMIKSSSVVMMALIMLNSIDNEKQIQSVIRWFMIGAAGLSILAILQFVVPYKVAAFYQLEAIGAGAEVIRATGTTRGPWAIGGVLGMAAVLCLALLTIVRGVISRPFPAVCAILSITAIILSNSRAGFMLVAAGTLAVFVFSKKPITALAMVAIVASVMVVFPYLVQRMIARIEQTGGIGYLESSAAWRIIIWKKMLSEFDMGSAFIGLGLLGSYVRYGYTPHSYYVGVLVQTGIIGVFYFTALAVSLWRHTWSNIRFAEGSTFRMALWKGIFSLNIGILAYSLTADTLNDILISQVLFFFWSFLYLRDYIAVGDYGCELDDESIYYQEQDPSEVYGD
jgi:O-antigen ligase